MQKNDSLTEDCKHCPKNPKATKPFVKFVRVPVKASWRKEIELTAKAEGKNPDCYICQVGQRLLNAAKQKYSD